MSLQAQKSHEERAELLCSATETRKAIQYIFIAYAYTVGRDADYIAISCIVHFCFHESNPKRYFIYRE